MQGCNLNKREHNDYANYTAFKSSDIRKLGADAKIIIALIKHQPQKRLDLCKNAKIDPSTFSRHKRILSGIIKETPDGFCLWNFNNPVSLWERTQEKLRKAGAPLIDIQLNKLRLGDQDPITGWYEKIFDVIINIKGILILCGAKEVQVATSIHVPDCFLGFLFTQGDVSEADRFFWRNEQYDIQEIENVIDGVDLSYRIAKLVCSYRSNFLIENIKLHGVRNSTPLEQGRT
jgi:hypothetical protein